jgi:RNA polymerase-interacting CarD/CdnL/TRCF family regulator
VSGLGNVGFAVDDLVVYASHGVGRVVSRRKESVTFEFDRELSVILPISRAVECVRSVSTEAELAVIGRVLGEPEVVSKENWQRRLKETRGKLASGAAASLAEVVRDASRRQSRVSAQKEPSRLSLSERQLYVTARKLLADEIGASRGVDSQSADEWIGDRLAQIADDEPSRVTTSALATETTVVGAAPSGLRARRRRR